MKTPVQVIHIDRRWLRAKRRKERYENAKDFLVCLFVAGLLYTLFVGVMYIIPWGLTW